MMSCDVFIVEADTISSINRGSRSRNSFTMTTSREEVTYIQKLYSTVNNDDLLEFRIPSNVKGNMLLSDVMLRFVVKIPQTNHADKIIPQNFFGAKQFGSLEIRINGEAVTRRNCSNEYFCHYISTKHLQLGIT